MTDIIVIGDNEEDPKVRMAERGRETSQNTSDDLLAQMLEVQALYPKLDRRPNVMHAGEARDHGRMVTPSGAGTSGVDDPARGKRLVTESGCGKRCDIYHRLSLLVVIPVKYNSGDGLIRLGIYARSLTRPVVWGQCRLRESGPSFEKGIDIHSVNVTRRLIPLVGLSVYAHAKSVDMRDDVPVGFNPGNGLATWKPRLIERFSPE
ncbi:hypothetical protein Lal_00039184 [Lupinus albus]|nr:hypothetical protein Lal_00039184 [Lupinus albus]